MNGLFVLIPLGGMALSGLFLVGIYKLLARWLDHRHQPAALPAAQEEIDELRRQVATLEELPERVSELEERLDFAERMLARRERQPLPGPE